MFWVSSKCKYHGKKQPSVTFFPNFLLKDFCKPNYTLKCIIVSLYLSFLVPVPRYCYLMPLFFLQLFLSLYRSLSLFFATLAVILRACLSQCFFAGLFFCPWFMDNLFLFSVCLSFFLYYLLTYITHYY